MTPEDDRERRPEQPGGDAVDRAADDRDRDVAEHRAGDRGDDPLRHPAPAIGAARVEQRVDGADQAREVDHQEQRQEDRRDERENEAESRDDDPEDTSGGTRDALGDLLGVRRSALGCGAVAVDPGADRGVVADVVDDLRQLVDEVPERADERREQEQDEDDPKCDQPEDEGRRTRAAPHRQLSLHPAHHRLEDEREEQRQEQCHDDFGDVDERPRERDEERDEQHRAHRDVDVHGARAWQQKAPLRLALSPTRNRTLVARSDDPGTTRGVGSRCDRPAPRRHPVRRTRHDPRRRLVAFGSSPTRSCGTASPTSAGRPRSIPARFAASTRS